MGLLSPICPTWASSLVYCSCFHELGTKCEFLLWLHIASSLKWDSIHHSAGLIQCLACLLMSFGSVQKTRFGIWAKNLFLTPPSMTNYSTPFLWLPLFYSPSFQCVQTDRQTGKPTALSSTKQSKWRFSNYQPPTHLWMILRGIPSCLNFAIKTEFSYNLYSAVPSFALSCLFWCCDIGQFQTACQVGIGQVNP